MTRQSVFRAKKSLGQNFLVDRNILRHIVERADIQEDDSVLEIGAGQGVLTRELAAAGCAHLFSVEIDRGLSPFLSDLPALYPDRLALLWGDALSIDYTGLVPPPTKVVANIPYNITTPLVWKLLEQLPGGGADYFLLMVQREAAERIIAPPHTKERYPLGVTVELMGSASIVRHVSPGSFRPSPAVSSALLEIRLSGQNRDLPNDPLWRSMLRTGFAMRRKMLINNLRLHYPSVEWNELFQRAGVGEKARAEELTSAQWLALRACAG
jgi:16S rRNA (adenine1518-N6/adenine1519-N6)-dimethyltransferase